MSERNAAAVTALARAAALSLYAGQEGQINLHKLLDDRSAKKRAGAAYDRLIASFGKTRKS